MEDHTVELGMGSYVRLYDDGSVLIVEGSVRLDKGKTVCLDGLEAEALARAILKHFNVGVE